MRLRMSRIVRSAGKSPSRWPLAIKASRTSAADRLVYRRGDLSSGSAYVWGSTIARMSSANRGSFCSLGRRARAVKFSRQRTPVTSLVPSLLDGLTPPAETSLGMAGAAAAQFGGDLGHVRSTLVSGQPSGPGTDQGVESLDGVFHGGDPAWKRGDDRSTISLGS